jgi:upstream activation factor subunit UAF30
MPKSTKKSTTESPKARKSTASTAGKAKGGRKPNAALMKPVQPSEQLARIVGEKPLPRTELTKKIWDYIKKNGLQDPQNRRMIKADDRLKSIFDGRRQVNMFEMTKLINKHVS